MKADLTIKRVQADEGDGYDDYMAIRAKCEDGTRIKITLSLEDFALAITGQHVDAEVLQLAPIRSAKCHTS